jgi:hypothetical protein
MQRHLTVGGHHDELARTLREIQCHPRYDRDDVHSPGRTRRLLDALLGRDPAPATPLSTNSVTIRRARPADGRALAELAEMSERRVPRDPVIVAEVGSEVVAAMGVQGGPAVTDVRRATADVVELLELRSSQVRRALAA